MFWWVIKLINLHINYNSIIIIMGNNNSCHDDSRPLKFNDLITTHKNNQQYVLNMMDTYDYDLE